jgi:DNA-binding GntR family transcriptional regulator
MQARGQLTNEREVAHNRGMNPIESLQSLENQFQGALRHQVVRRLLSTIFLGDLPSGTRLIVMKLAAQFGLSSTPVREALVELEAVGIVRFEHNRGAIVKPFGPDELREIYQLRRILEVEAARTACGRIDRCELESVRGEMKKLLRARRDRQWVEREMATDRRLHELITSSCGSERLAQEIHRYDNLVQSLRDVVGRERRAQQQALEEHLAIIEGMLAADAEAAGLAMARHIERAAESVSAVLFSAKKGGNRPQFAPN